jgi:hypothetical protein
MIGVPATLLVSFVLLILLLFVLKGVAAARQMSSAPDVTLLDEAAYPPCPPEFAARLFAPDDSQFVSSMRSPQLQKLFYTERKAVALLWVQQTSAAIQRTMHEHQQMARASADLEFSTEVKLLLLYAELMCICGLLFVAIQSAGPMGLRRLALYADSQSQHLARVQESLLAAASPPEAGGIGAL